MCDTFFLRKDGVSWFAKNSDREPDEPQALVWIPPADTDSRQTVRTTYMDIPQVPKRLGVLLSQPSWLWGGEIGVNSAGVAIGNEAVFSKLIDRRGHGLLGMDLLRLGLERGSCAREALDVITQFLERHGQGGPAGYRDKGFRYDNSFLIADAREAWVLETAGRLWAAKCVQSWAISNCYSLGSDFDLHSAGLQDEARRLGLWNGRGPFDFGKAFDTHLYAWVGGAHKRRALNDAALACGLTPGWAACAARLRDHGLRGDDFPAHDNRQICLHAGSMLRPSQTTASLIARLAPDGDVRVAATGTSAPCMGLFAPTPLGPSLLGGLVIPAGSLVGNSPWARFEPVHQRALFDTAFRKELRASRDALEAELFLALECPSPDWNDLAAQAESWRAHWAMKSTASPYQASGRLRSWWHKRALRELADANKTFPSTD